MCVCIVSLDCSQYMLLKRRMPQMQPDQKVCPCNALQVLISERFSSQCEGYLLHLPSVEHMGIS